MNQPKMTAIEIPCCLCGTFILPNEANQCTSCLAAEVNLTSLLQAGPGGSDYATINQCRQCRKFQVTEKLFKTMQVESPELLSVCLKSLPALSNSNNNGLTTKIKLMEAMWIWTEPHSMRLKLRLTIRAAIQGVEIQQRVPVELRVHFKQCPTCNREYTNRTWHAVLQLRQKRTDDAPKKGLAALEMALAKNARIRKHVLKIDSTRNGFDFYFLNLPEAQAFASYVARVAPMRIKTTKKLVSADVKSNTANLKHTVACDLVPLCRDDLIVIHKSAKGVMSGRLALIGKVSSVVHLIDAAPTRSPTRGERVHAELAPETYYRQEKFYQLAQTSNRMVRFVVLDVELCDNSIGGVPDGEEDSPALTTKGPVPHALADVEVARESDFGQNDETFHCVTHLGNLLHPGDVVLGYDVNSMVLLGAADWDTEKCFQSSFVMPDIVLVKKVKDKTIAMEEANGDDTSTSATYNNNNSEDPKSRMSKRKEKRRMRNEKKSKALEESAMRMGFVSEEIDDYLDEEYDPDLVADLDALENDLAAQEQAAGATAAGSNDEDKEVPAPTCDKEEE